jgi:outer membrane protein assembly factor BamE
MRRFIWGVLSLFLLFFSALGCQTNELKQYEKLKVGMDKGDVIDVMGSPRRTERWHGQDRWTYVFYQDREQYLKEVHFMGGRASYIGDLWKPEISADEVDRQNEASNREIEALWSKQREDKRAQSSKYFGSDPGTQQILHVPTFQPVQ